MKKLHTMSWLAGLLLLGLGCHTAPPPVHGHAMSCQHECPMHQTAALSEVKVQSTQAGAVIELVAKRPEDAAKVQQHAQQMAEMMNKGECPMHDSHGDEHPHHNHHHGQPVPNRQ